MKQPLSTTDFMPFMRFQTHQLGSLLFLAICSLASPRATVCAQGDPAQDLVRQARQLNEQGKQTEALAKFEEAIKVAPTSYSAHVGAGMALDLLGRYDDARKHLGHAIELASPSQKASALRTMAVSFLFERRGKDAIQYGKQAVDLTVATGDYNAAAEVTNEFARILLESNALEEAQDWYKQGYDYALKQPALADSAKDLWEFRYENALARIAAKRGQRNEAEQHVAAAKAAFGRGRIPGQAPYVSYLTGYVSFHLHDDPAAILDLERGDQRDPFILALLAQANERSGDKAKAMEYWKQVLTFNSHNPTNAYARPLALARVK